MEARRHRPAHRRRAHRRRVIAILLVIAAGRLGDEGTTKQSLWAETGAARACSSSLLTFACFFGTEPRGRRRSASA